MFSVCPPLMDRLPRSVAHTQLVIQVCSGAQ